MFNGGVRGKRAKDGVGFLSTAEQFNQKTFLVPTVTSFSVTDVSYVPLDNTAVDTAGGEIIVINGSGFASGATVQVGATTIGSVTFIDQNRLAFTAPALSSGSYTIYVTNSNGGTGILVSGLVYSGLPTYSTTAGSLGTVYETANINTAVVATGDAPITYSLLSGTLPTGTTLNSNGTITGNAPVDSSSTTYSFTIQASDPQLQETTRAFSLTTNTDVVTWSTPAAGNAYSVFVNSAMSNVSLSASSAAGYNITYAANTLPTGVSLSGNTIFGTPTVEQTVYTALTATAATTGRSASRFISWSVSLFGSPTIGTATATSGTTATVTFTAPVNNGGSTITSYTATSSPGGITGTLNQAGSGTITVSGLTTGTSYTFTVTATNAIGTSPPSAASNSVTPAAPFNVTFNPTASFESTYNGPTLGAMQTAYTGTPVASTLALWNSTQGFLMYDTPVTGTYRITVRGARGGKDTSPTSPAQQYGRGQIIRGDVSLTAGDKVVVVCGAAPLHINTPGDTDQNCGAPGGGASFVALTTSNSSSGALIPLVVAAGGAGGNAYQSNQALYDGQSYTNASNWLSTKPAGFTFGGGGRGDAGGGGAGWSANATREGGGTNLDSGAVAEALNSTALGGRVDAEVNAKRYGGFGGGGYSFANDLSAGGGGYYGGFEHYGATHLYAGAVPATPLLNATSYVNTGLVSTYGDSTSYGYNDTFGSVTIERL